MAGIEIREYQTGDEGRVLGLVHEALGAGPTGTRSEDFWRWKHQDNPFGPSLMLVATDGGEIVGLRALMRWHFVAGGSTLQALRAVDTATRQDYRRAGVFSALTREATQRAKGSGVDLIFNTPNNTVMPGYLKLGWKHVSTIRPQIKVLNYPRFLLGLARSRGRRQASVLCPSGRCFRRELPRFAELLQRPERLEELLVACNCRRNGLLATDQTVDYLRWRYEAHPYVEYRVVSREENGELLGCVVARPNGRFGLREVVLSELLLRKPDERLARSLLAELEKGLSADYIVAYFREGSFERQVLRRHGFHEVQRQGINLTVNVLKPPLAPHPGQLSNWELSLGDLEIF